MEKRTHIRIYISKHVNAPDEHLQTVIAGCKVFGIDPLYHVKGSTYDKYMVKNAHIVIIIPWYDEDFFKLGKGTVFEYDLAKTYESQVVFYNRVSKKLQAIPGMTPMKGEGIHFMGLLKPGGESVDMGDLIEKAKQSDRPFYEPTDNPSGVV